MHCFLAAAGETKERRIQRLPHVHAEPSLKADGAESSIDLGERKAREKGVFLMVHVIIDLLSRYVVGWMLAAKECKHLAAPLSPRPSRATASSLV